MHQLSQERSVGELFGQLTQDLSLLVRQETQLAKVEIQEKISRASRDLASLAAGGVVALVGGFALVTAIILLLVDPIGLEPWLAA
ncbi:MAG TPA: phage holin family protein, partial [Gemmatimonadales bacterium]|nr:phage holin family protein [Gemmatimonadales bacterium]